MDLVTKMYYGYTQSLTLFLKINYEIILKFKKLKFNICKEGAKLDCIQAYSKVNGLQMFVYLATICHFSYLTSL